MSSSKKRTEQPLAESAGVRVEGTAPADPYQALDELMAVVEELCPEWPERPFFDGTERMLL